VAGQGRGPARAIGHGRGGSVRRLSGARGSDVREREAGERKGGPDTIPAYVRRANTSADDHKQVGLRGGRGALCSLATLRT
jgi:hypothetical protein